MASGTASISPASRSTASDALLVTARDPLIRSLPPDDGRPRAACRAMPARPRGESS